MECQLDFAQLGLLHDPGTGRQRRVHALIFTAVVSRHMFVWLTYSHLDPSKKCRTYSKGNRQKVAVVAAFASDVELFILDEPTCGLDPLMESVFQDCVNELMQDGRTVLLSSHVLAEVETLCADVRCTQPSISWPRAESVPVT